MTIDSSDAQFPNPISSIDESCEPVSNLTLERHRQKSKQCLLIARTGAGITIDSRDEQCANAPSSIDQRCEPDSNITLERCPQKSKQCLLIVRTDAGMTIDSRDEQYSNTLSSIDKSCDPDSNVTLESFKQLVKQPRASVSTKGGIQIDDSVPLFEKTDAPMRKSLEPLSNLTDPIFISEKQPALRYSTSRSITRFDSRPTHSFSVFVAYSKTRPPQIRRKRLPSSIEIEFNFVPDKELQRRSARPARNRSVESDEQFEKASFSIRRGAGPAANVTDESLPQYAKQEEATVSRDEGRKIDQSNEQRENALGSITESDEPASNVMLARQREPRGQPRSQLGNQLKE
jgi:hypothetical protein